MSSLTVVAMGIRSEPVLSLEKWIYDSGRRGWCIFRPTHIRYTPLLTYAKSAIQHIRPIARGFTAEIWTCGRSARPPSLRPSRCARPRNCLNLTLKIQKSTAGVGPILQLGSES